MLRLCFSDFFAIHYPALAPSSTHNTQSCDANGQKVSSAGLSSAKCRLQALEHCKPGSNVGIVPSGVSFLPQVIVNRESQPAAAKTLLYPGAVGGIGMRSFDHYADQHATCGTVASTWTAGHLIAFCVPLPIFIARLSLRTVFYVNH